MNFIIRTRDTIKYYIVPTMDSLMCVSVEDYEKSVNEYKQAQYWIEADPSQPDKSIILVKALPPMPVNDPIIRATRKECTYVVYSAKCSLYGRTLHIMKIPEDRTTNIQSIQCYMEDYIAATEKYITETEKKIRYSFDMFDLSFVNSRCTSFYGHMPVTFTVDDVKDSPSHMMEYTHASTLSFMPGAAAAAVTEPTSEVRKIKVVKKAVLCSSTDKK